MSANFIQEIETFVSSQPVTLFMKGTPEFPMCGFSAQTMEVLRAAGLDTARFATFNVLENRPLFEELKAWSNWPTSPQLYVNGKLVGGCDIVVELYQRGELQELLQQAQTA